MGDDLRRLLLGHATVHRTVERVGDLLDLPRGDQRGDSDEAAVAGRQIRAPPEIAEEVVRGVLKGLSVGACAQRRVVTGLRTHLADGRPSRDGTHCRARRCWPDVFPGAPCKALRERGAASPAADGMGAAGRGFSHLLFESATIADRFTPAH